MAVDSSAIRKASGFCGFFVLGWGDELIGGASNTGFEPKTAPVKAVKEYIQRVQDANMALNGFVGLGTVIAPLRVTF